MFIEQMYKKNHIQQKQNKKSVKKYLEAKYRIFKHF